MQDRYLTHLSCFTGVGCVDLAAEWAGFKTVGQIEKGTYARKILEERWPGIPRWSEVKDVTARSIREAGIRDITVLSGGFPCQPFSTAGSRKGTKDDRYLWPEMLRLVKILRPTWVIGENVAGLSSMVEPVCEPVLVERSGLPGAENEIYEESGRFILYGILEDLEKIGYSVQALNIPACAVGALHERKRIFIVAHTNRIPGRKMHQAIVPYRGNFGSWGDAECSGIRQPAGGPASDVADTQSSRGWGLPVFPGGSEQADPDINRGRAALAHTDNSPPTRLGQHGRKRSARPEPDESCPGSDDVPHTISTGREEFHASPKPGGSGHAYWRADPSGRCWIREPPMGRVVDGPPPGVDRVECLGNAVVPQQIYPIFKTIWEIETGVIS